jgi:hypothetical protein
MNPDTSAFADANPTDVAALRGFMAFASGLPCPFDYFTQRELVDAFYAGMARAERRHADSEVVL